MIRLGTVCNLAPCPRAVVIIIKFCGRVFCHSAHTRRSKRGEGLFFRGETRAPKPGEDHNRKQTEQENTKKQKGPTLGLRGQNPNQETRKTGLGSPPRAKTPNSPETLLNLVDKEHREVEERQDEQAIPKRAKRNDRK